MGCGASKQAPAAAAPVTTPAAPAPAPAESKPAPAPVQTKKEDAPPVDGRDQPAQEPPEPKTASPEAEAKIPRYAPAPESTQSAPGVKPKVVFVLGGPGAGKGTQCANIVKEFGWVHLSAGDLLRAEQATESADSALIKDYIKEGKIVPVEITIKLLLKAMQTSASKKFLIDGFPRSVDNRQGWEKQVGDQVEELFCLNFDCTEEELEKRLLKRGETSGRSDDNIESIKKRFVAFQEQTKPVLEFFKGKGMLRTISSVGEIDAVWGETKVLFE